MLGKQQQAPDFSVPDQSGRQVSLSDFTGKGYLVIYFYPKDDTPGCTIEANQFSALADEFAAANTVVLGVSRDSCSSHREFIEKFGLRVNLLADTEGAMCQAYDVWKEKEKNGIRKMGIVRSTFIINRDGMIIDAEYGVDPEGHAEKVLQKIRNT